MNSRKAIEILKRLRENAGMPEQGSKWKANAETIALDMAIQALEKDVEKRVAVNIAWDVSDPERTDEEREELVATLPQEMEIPPEIKDDDIEEYLTEQTGFTVFGYCVERYTPGEGEKQDGEPITVNGSQCECPKCGEYLGTVDEWNDNYFDNPKYCSSCGEKIYLRKE